MAGVGHKLLLLASAVAQFVKHLVETCDETAQVVRTLTVDAVREVLVDPQPVRGIRHRPDGGHQPLRQHPGVGRRRQPRQDPGWPPWWPSRIAARNDILDVLRAE